jgi:Leucine-rich repeat (LRR) protein
MEWPFSGLQEVNFSCQKLSHETIAEIGDFPNLRILDLSLTNVTDAQLVILQKLPLLESLNLSQTAITSELGLWISHLTKLRYLLLSSTNVDDALISKINTLPNLKKLDLSDTQIGSLGGIENCPALEEFWIPGTKINDHSIEYLLKIEHLKYLNATGTSMSAAGIDWLRSNSQAQVDY